MNIATITNEIKRAVDIQSFYRKVDIEIIRIHTDYHFVTLTQTTPDNKEI